jgi:hypothetical protein
LSGYPANTPRGCRSARSDAAREVRGWHEAFDGKALGGGPKPGARIAPAAAQTPVGSGPSPRFALFAAASDAAERIAERFPALLEPGLRAPLQKEGLWLARPDGYAACAAKRGDEAVIERYLAEQV